MFSSRRITSYNLYTAFANDTLMTLYYILAFVSMLYKIYNHLPSAPETRVKLFSAYTHDEKRISGKQALCLMFFNYV